MLRAACMLGSQVMNSSDTDTIILIDASNALNQLTYVNVNSIHAFTEPYQMKSTKPPENSTLWLIATCLWLYSV